MRKGQLKVRQDKEKGIWLIDADEKELKRFEEIRNRPRQWIYNSKIQRFINIQFIFYGDSMTGKSQ